MLNVKFLEKPQDQVSFVYLMAILVSVLVIFVVADGVFRDREARKELLFRQVRTVADLATDDVARSLAGVRDSMRLLTRMPVFRQSAIDGRLIPFLLRFERQIEQGLDSLTDILEAIDRRKIKVGEETVLYIDTAAALGRRIWHSMGWLQESIEESNLPVESGLTSTINSDWMPLLRTGSKNLLDVFFTPLRFLDRIFPFGLPTLADPTGAENVLRASLNDRDLIRSISVKRLDGIEIVGVTEIAEGLNLLSGWVKSAARAARSFYPGPVWFDEGLGRPIWNAAVPLRDEERRPFAMMSSQVDLAFLGELAQKTRFTPTSHLLVVDETGVVIAHPKSSLVANQVNLIHSNRAVFEALNGQDGVLDLRLGDTTYVVAFRALKKIDASLLPGWGILYMTPLSEAFDSLFWGAVNALLLIAVALYLIFGCVGMIIEVIEEAEA